MPCLPPQHWLRAVRLAAPTMVALLATACGAAAPPAPDDSWQWSEDLPPTAFGDASAPPDVVDGCELGLFGRQGGGWRLTGSAHYLKRLRSEGDGTGEVLTAIRRAEVIATRGSTAVGTGTTDDGGCFRLEGESAAPTAVIVTAKAAGPHLAVLVTSAAGQPWTVQASAGRPVVRAEELYLAGAFNVVDAAVRLADAIPASIHEVPVAGVVVRWGEDSRPACGSCYYSTDFVLELTGAAGDIDAHDDAVVMHELAHWVEAAFGVYSNPGGAHDMEKRAPTLAWSEGFATWFQAVVRGVPDYVDRQPSRVYRLSVEAPPVVSHGVALAGNPNSDVSEALIYGALWDLVDAPELDDDPAREDFEDAMVAALRPFGAAGLDDAGPAGADLTDFLRQVSCAVTAIGPLQAVLDAFEFPWTASCPGTEP